MLDSRGSTKLSKLCTVAQYLSLQNARNRDAIADFVVSRFEERYLDPVEGDPRRKNGFTIMAVNCLLIESLESFRQGWEDTTGKSQRAFNSFFLHWDAFSDFRPVSGEFYKHVRCGILHQAETTGGWRIIRKGPILDGTIINATRFATSLRQVVRSYASALRHEDWNSETWHLFRKKMDAICQNTQA